MNTPEIPVSSEPPYAFVSYSHKNEDIVHQDLFAITQIGYGVWFDSGISAGARWRTELTQAIDSAEFMVFYISRDSVASSHCLQEVHYAADQDVPILPVVLEETVLPPSIRLVLAERQAIYRSRLSAADYELSLCSAYEMFLEQGRPTERRKTVTGADGFRKNRIHLGVFTHIESSSFEQTLAQDVIQYLSWQGGVFRPHGLATPSSSKRHIDYELIIQVSELPSQLDVRFTIQEAHSKELVWTTNRQQEREGFLQVSCHLAENLGEGAIRKIAAHEVRVTSAVPINELGYAQLILIADQLNYLDYDETQRRFALLDRAIELDPNCGIAFASIANLRSWKSLNQDKSEGEDSVLSAVRDALRKDPDDPFVLLSTGTTLCRLGVYERGLALLRRAHQMAPTVRAKSDLARGLCFAGQPEEAVSLFNSIIETIPVGQTYPYARLAVALTQAGKLEEALVQSRAATTHFSEDYYGWIVHCNLLSQLGEIDAARAALAEAKKLLPKLQLDRVIERTRQTYGRTDNQIEWLTKGLASMLP